MPPISIESPRRATPPATSLQTDLIPLLVIAAADILVHLATNGRYGFHRDELQFLVDARHMDWGFVAYPPFTSFMEHIGLALFGLSLVGLRLFSVLTQAIAIVITFRTITVTHRNRNATRGTRARANSEIVAAATT